MLISKSLIKALSEAENMDDVIVVFNRIAKEITQEERMHGFLEKNYAFFAEASNVFLRYGAGVYYSVLNDKCYSDKEEKSYRYVSDMLRAAKEQYFATPELQFPRIDAWKTYQQITSVEEFAGKNYDAEAMMKEIADIYQQKIDLAKEAVTSYQNKQYWKTIEAILQGAHTEYLNFNHKDKNFDNALIGRAILEKQQAVIAAFIFLGATNFYSLEKYVEEFTLVFKEESRHPEALKKEILKALADFQSKKLLLEYRGDVDEKNYKLIQFFSKDNFHIYDYMNYNDYCSSTQKELFARFLEKVLAADLPEFIEKIARNLMPNLSPKEYFDCLIELEKKAILTGKEKIADFLNDHLNSLPHNTIYADVWRERIHFFAEEKDIVKLNNIFILNRDYFLELSKEIKLDNFFKLKETARKDNSILVFNILLNDGYKNCNLALFLFSCIKWDWQDVFAKLLERGADINFYRYAKTPAQFLLLPCNGLSAERKKSWLIFLHAKGADLTDITNYAIRLHNDYVPLVKTNENLAEEVKILEECIDYIKVNQLDKKWEAEKEVCERKEDEKKEAERNFEKEDESLENLVSMNHIPEVKIEVSRKKNSTMRLFSYFDCEAKPENSQMDNPKELQGIRADARSIKR